MRDSDAMGRIGGEEFSVFLPNTDVAGAMVLAESIRQAIESLMPSIGEGQLRITASIGVARNHHSDQTMLEIQKLADQAMYRAKAAGRNRVSSVDDSATA
jgi:diguanylate cyclase (GGDEF)-like protein